MATWSQVGFQDTASPIITYLVYFHDHAILILVIILSLVVYAFVHLMINKLTVRSSAEAHIIETVWTVLPALVLIVLAFPSLRLLYLMEETSAPAVTIKAIGHQWYWRYEYSDFTDLSFDSYMVPEDDLEVGQFRLLEVDNRTVVPISTEIRVLVTGADVIHSWTVPRLGVKADAIPGRLNQINVFVNRTGVFYGQCSEICGANHSFIPIALEAVPPSTFIRWVRAMPTA